MSESKTFVIQKKKKKNSILNLLGRKKKFCLKKNIFPNENVDHVITKKYMLWRNIFDSTTSSSS